jgi:phosphoribosylformimino-5-aminoimidazole carboxamide ribotide isomerase
MRIIPAVDVLGGEAVRLLRGDYGAVTAYGPDPAAIVHEFADAGADIVHIVDLEAARGGPRQTETIRAILEVGVRVQIGGGIRTAPDARRMVDEGAARVVVGSALVDGDEAPVREIVEAVGPGAVVAAIDVRQGRAMGSGWLWSG